MKKGALLNQPVSAVIAGLGHQDEVVIADAGLPIPSGPQKVDLALTENIPSFLETMRVILSELEVESAIVAEEMTTASPHIYEALQNLLGGKPIDRLPHQKFKARTHSARAVIRTGEFTPYANIILIAGVVF